MISAVHNIVALAFIKLLKERKLKWQPFVEYLTLCTALPIVNAGVSLDFLSVD